jgi:hypothetical protein
MEATQTKTDALYSIIDTRTGRQVATAKTLKDALRMVDRRDQAAGGSRYTYRRIER